MYPTYLRSNSERTVDEIAGYPIDVRVRKQMIERAKADGVNYADVVKQVRQIIQRCGADSDDVDAELEVYLTRRGPKPNEPGLQSKNRKPAAAFDPNATVTR